MCDACGKRTTLLAEDDAYRIVCAECNGVETETEANECHNDVS